jgi:hypothetical protein
LPAQKLSRVAAIGVTTSDSKELSYGLAWACGVPAMSSAAILGVDLREAVMACLSGGESRCWTIAELVERFKNLGVCATRASVTAALAELALELELSSSRAVAPARTRNRMDPGAQIRALRATFRRQTAPSQRGERSIRGA